MNPSVLALPALALERNVSFSFGRNFSRVMRLDITDQNLCECLMVPRNIDVFSPVCHFEVAGRDVQICFDYIIFMAASANLTPTAASAVLW